MYACIHSPPNFSPIQTGNRPPSRWGQVLRLAWVACDAVECHVRKLIYLGSRQPLLRWRWNQLSLITWARALGLVSSCPAFSSSPCGFLDLPGGTCGKEPTCQCRIHKRCIYYSFHSKQFNFEFKIPSISFLIISVFILGTLFEVSSHQDLSECLFPSIWPGMSLWSNHRAYLV